jgi:Arc/MetJ-type ribon-helix-helix transcriptional regulator
MARLPDIQNTNSEIFTMRINPRLKDKLWKLVQNKYGKNCSDVVRTLIDSAYSKRF